MDMHFIRGSGPFEETGLLPDDYVVRWGEVELGYVNPKRQYIYQYVGEDLDRDAITRNLIKACKRRFGDGEWTVSYS